MKNNIIVVLAIVLLASCSAPKYSYYFDHYKNNAGKKQIQPVKESLPAVDPQMLVASTANQPIVPSEAKTDIPTEVKKPYLQMSKSERKILRHELKKEIKAYVASKKIANSINSAHAGMDHDLKLAAIFGAVGIVALIIGGNVFSIVGGIALIIGIVFFVMWLVRQ